MRVPKEVVQQLLKAKQLVIVSHLGPEGDAIGSALALALGLKQLGKRAEVIAKNGVPHRYAFLPGADSVRSCPSFKPDLLVLVDCADIKRADLPERLRCGDLPVLVVDHHPPSHQNPNGWTMWVAPKAAATGEMIAVLLRTLKVTFTREIATCLYAALVADTGVFRFRNTTPRVLRLAAFLLERGVDPQEVVERTVEMRSFAATRLLGRMLSKARLEPERGLCWAVLSHKDFTQTNTTDEDTENFANFLRAVEGVRVAVLFREIEQNHVRVSFRSQEGVDVAAIARKFGGGGHPVAAGCRLREPLKVTVLKVLKAVRQILDSESTLSLGR